MRIKYLLVVVLTLLVAGLLAAQDAKVDFSGTWTMNEDKSDFGDGGGGRGGRGGGRMGHRNVFCRMCKKDILMTGSWSLPGKNGRLFKNNCRAER